MGSRYLDGPTPKAHRANPELVERIAHALAAELAAGAPGPRWDARVLSLRAMTGEDEHETLAELLGRARRIVDAQDFVGGPSDPLGSLELLDEDESKDEERSRLIELAAVAYLSGDRIAMADAQDALADAGHDDVEEADIRFAAWLIEKEGPE